MARYAIILGRMAYEVLNSSENTHRASIDPMFQLRPDGVMRFNVTAAQELRKLGLERVLVLWDRGKYKVAFSAAPPNDQRAYKVTYNRKGNGAQLVARTFPRYVGLIAEAPIRVSIHLQGKMLEGEIKPEFISPPGTPANAKAVKKGRPAGRRAKQPTQGGEQ
jgi:hypothetical protein